MITVGITSQTITDHVSLEPDVSGKTYQNGAHQQMQHTIRNPTKEGTYTSGLKERDIDNHYKIAVNVMLTQMTANKGIENFGKRPLPQF